MKLISLWLVVVAWVSYADALDPDKCTTEYVGKRDHITNVVQSFSECHPNYDKMGEVLTARFLRMSPAKITMKFFRWVTICNMPQDYKAAGADCFFNIMLGLPIPPASLRRLSDDKVNLRTMQTEIPSNIGYVSSDFKENVECAVTVGISVAQLAITVYQTLAPVAARMLTHPDTVKPMVERVVNLIRTVAGEVGKGKDHDGGLGWVVGQSGLGPKLAKIGRIVFGPYPIEDGFWNAPDAPPPAAA